MARNTDQNINYAAYFRRIALGILLFLFFVLFVVWRIDNPRIERIRMDIIDRFVPQFTWAISPMSRVMNWFESYQSYEQIHQQNQELRRELQQMKAWKEAALQLEQENARLLTLNNVRLDPKFTHITGKVLADSGSPYRQSVLLNVGKRDGIVDGWAAVDGLGLVGRVSGLSNSTARVILVTDNSSKIAINIKPSGQKALMVGDNTNTPPVEFLEMPELVRPGDQVITSGDGGVFPHGVLIGQIVKSSDGRLRVKLSADLERLDFIRLIRSATAEIITDPGSLIGVDSVGAENGN